MSELEVVFSVRESPEGGYEARAVGHSIFTEADNWGELKEMCAEAVYCHFGRALPFRIEISTSAAEADSI
jgi:hypothetical protein